MNSVNI